MTLLTHAIPILTPHETPPRITWFFRVLLQPEFKSPQNTKAQNYGIHFLKLLGICHTGGSKVLTKAYSWRNTFNPSVYIF